MSAEGPITVLVVDDHDLLREGVSSVLTAFEDIDVIGEAATGEIAIEMVEAVGPDVVVMDLVMPGIGGIETIRRLRAMSDDLGIVALSSFSDGDRVREALDAGANGYMVKSVDADSLARAVRSALAGQGAFSPQVTEALTARPAPSVELLGSLTAREAEIAERVSEGRTNAEIAHELDLSIFTVKNHVSNILMKLHVQTRTEAAAFILTSRNP